MMEYMDSTQTEMIIAAVECNHSPKNGRLEEYSPFSFRDSEFGFVKGRGKLTMDWMSGPFKAYIDEHYRTLGDREHTFIAGSSMGGLMSLYALMEYNSVYSRAAALSPSVALVHSEIARADDPKRQTGGGHGSLYGLRGAGDGTPGQYPALLFADGGAADDEAHPAGLPGGPRGDSL